MRPLRLIPLLFTLLPPAFAAPSDTPSRYDTYLTTSPNQPLELTDTTYTALTAKPRDYAVAALFTARDKRFACSVCEVVQPEWELVARSWNRDAVRGRKSGKKGDEEEGGAPKVVWATLDFLNARPIFQQFSLSSAPVMIVLPPTTGPYAKRDQNPFRYDFTSPITADQLTNLLNRALSTAHHPPIVRPFNYARLATFTTVFLALFTAATVLAPYAAPLLRSRKLWAAASLLGVLLFTSGHMFNHIRKVPYVSGNGRGGVSYFTPGFQAQLGMESQIVASLYASLTFATLLLATKAPRIVDPGRQHITIVVAGVVILVLYSGLLKIFRFKNAGYPFWLPPF